MQIFLNFCLIFFDGKLLCSIIAKYCKEKWQILVHTFTQAFTSTLAKWGLGNCV